MKRYIALVGPNTKQFWLYDEVNETYIDPPTEVLEEIEKICRGDGEETYESLNAAQARLEELARQEPDWLHDGHEYPAEFLGI